MTEKQKYVILTGATGLLGQYLMRDLLRRGHNLVVIARPTKKLSADERIEQAMQMWDAEAGELLRRPVVLTGDITQENLGVDDDSRQWIAQNCDRMIHSAASLTFQEADGEPWRTNVDGTRNVLDFCKSCGVTKMHHISTAYVCGHRDQVVMEDELDVGQEFRNDYEKSKFQSETMVREAGFAELTVYRPVVITGDSRTGYTSTYHGTYLYMRLGKSLAQSVEPDEDGNRHIPIRWGLTGDERRNITHVDWNSEVICNLFDNPQAHGRTFHLAPRIPLTMGDAIGFATRYYGITGIEFMGFKNKPPHTLTDLERWIWSSISIYGSYDFMDPEFDTTNLREFSPVPECPVLDWESAQQLMDYAEEDRWGKKKRPPLTIPDCDVESQLDKLKTVSDESTEITINLEIVGPGGGQWRVELGDGQVVDWRRGVANDGIPLTMSAAQFAQLVGSGESATEDLRSLLPGQNRELTSQLAVALFS